MSEIEYHILFPKTYLGFTESTVTFSINNVKSRELSALYFKLHFYNADNEKFFTYRSPRWVVTTEYTRRSRTVELNDDVVDTALYVQIELITVGIDSQNPIYFNGLMFNEGEDKGYSMPYQQIRNMNVGVLNTRYANFYNSLEDAYLQVIRPTGKALLSDVLTACECTVIAPHFNEETDIDDPINVYMEFINQTEQTIDVLR